jgi:hypothetical protein
MIIGRVIVIGDLVRIGKLGNDCGLGGNGCGCGCGSGVSCNCTERC